MSKRVDARSVAEAIQGNFRASKSGHRQFGAADDASRLTRSTFKAPTEAIIGLRKLALENRCAMNDLILMAIDNLLSAAGRPCAIAVNAQLREQITGAATRPKLATGNSV